MNAALSAAAPALAKDAMAEPAAGLSTAKGRNESRAKRFLELALLAVSGVFLYLHFVHLRADFPNYSPWMDWSKYTDEGWYGDAAIRELQRGQWYVRGDFNPAVALPVWPFLEWLVFRMTGVSLVVARVLSVSVFAGVLVVAYSLVRRSFAGPSAARAPNYKGHSLAPALAVSLLAVSPFCYVFSRLAILEPILVLLGLLALLAASSTTSTPQRRLLQVLSLGLLIPLMVLTKTTAVFLLPSIAWMLWASQNYRLLSFLKSAFPAAVLGISLWSAYFFRLVRPRFLEDYRYLFSANTYTGMTRENAVSAIEQTVRHGLWIGSLVYPTAVLAILLAILFCKRSFRHPLVPSLLLWVAGYAAFLAYHDNLQPRYYLVLAVPLTLLVPIVVEQGFRWLPQPRTRVERSDRLVLLATAAAGFLFIFSVDAVRTLHYVLTPQYTFTAAAEAVRRIVRSEPSHNPLVLSISGSDLSLMTGVPSICDDFGTMTLEDRVTTYRPGWFATWNEVDDDKMDALWQHFRLKRVAAFPAFDDPERNQLILYRLDPIGPDLPRNTHRRSVPRVLTTRPAPLPGATPSGVRP